MALARDRNNFSLKNLDKRCGVDVQERGLSMKGMKSTYKILFSEYGTLNPKKQENMKKRARALLR